MDKDTVVTLLKYKRWIDFATLQAIRAIDGTVHGEKRHLTIRLMNHIHVVDMIFRANLRGRPHGYTALNTPETPTVDELETAMTACTDEYIQYVSAMTPRRFPRTYRLQICRRRRRQYDRDGDAEPHALSRRLSPWGGGLDDWRMRRRAAERCADRFPARPSFLTERNHSPSITRRISRSSA
ncbi:DinB family protein [Klebsiella pneumoniae]|nr:DinB family protein [Klebsiella pneumoniae]